MILSISTNIFRFLSILFLKIWQKVKNKWLEPQQHYLSIVEVAKILYAQERFLQEDTLGITPKKHIMISEQLQAYITNLVL